MSAESPHKSNGRGGHVVAPQPVSDRSIIESVAGFINEVVPQAYTSLPATDSKECITWARFEYADLNDPALYPDTADERSSTPPLLLVLGYGSGVQVWAVPANGEASEVLSWRQGVVRTLRILPTPLTDSPVPDSFGHKRPLVALCDSTGPGPQFCSLSFISLRGGDQVKSIKFKNPVNDVLANRRSIVVTFPERIAVFDACTLEDRLTVTTCYPCPGPNPNPVSLGTRWLAYSERRLLPARRSSGGMEGEGVQSYTATVLHAAKSLGKGLRELGETVASSLTGGVAGTGLQRGVGGTAASQQGAGVVGGSCDALQPGIITIIDAQGHSSSQHAEETRTTDSHNADVMVAHFMAHSEPVVALAFDPSGMLLLTADKRGHDFHLFRIQPHPGGPSLAAVHHLYILHRGDTTAKVQDITFAADSRWVAVSTLRGTTHVFPIAPYGGPVGIRTHTTTHVVNRLSRFHRSAGLIADGRNSPVPSTCPTAAAGNYESILTSPVMPYPNPRLPPYPHPTIINPLAQIRQPMTHPLLSGMAPMSPNSLSQQAYHRNSQTRALGRSQSLSDDGTPGGSVPLRMAACFAFPRAWLVGSPTVSRDNSTKARKRAVDSLFVMACHGSLIEYDLEPKNAAGIPKEKVCDDTPIELEVHAKAQWLLLRPPHSSELQPPLPPSNPLMILPDHLPPASESKSEDMDERWLSQVEIVTHAGPHRRLWMGPQFTFKTYNAPSGTPLSLLEMEAVEVGTGGGSRPARSNPVNMPLTGGGRPIVPVLIESGSASSYEQSPRLAEVYGGDGDSDGSAGPGDTQLREDLADAMMESPGVPIRDTGGRVMFTVHGKRSSIPIEKVVNPVGTVITVAVPSEEEMGPMPPASSRTGGLIRWPTAVKELHTPEWPFDPEGKQEEPSHFSSTEVDPVVKYDSNSNGASKKSKSAVADGGESERKLLVDCSLKKQTELGKDSKFITEEKVERKRNTKSCGGNFQTSVSSKSIGICESKQSEIENSQTVIDLGKSPEEPRKKEKDTVLIESFGKLDSSVSRLQENSVGADLVGEDNSESTSKDRKKRNGKKKLLDAVLVKSDAVVTLKKSKNRTVVESEKVDKKEDRRSSTDEKLTVEEEKPEKLHAGKSSLESDKNVRKESVCSSDSAGKLPDEERREETKSKKSPKESVVTRKPRHGGQHDRSAVGSVDEPDKCQKTSEESVMTYKSKHKSVLESNLKLEKEGIGMTAGNSEKSTVQDTEKVDEHQKSLEETVTARNSKLKIVLESNLKPEEEDSEICTGTIQKSVVEDTQEADEHEKLKDEFVKVKKSKQKSILESNLRSKKKDMGISTENYEKSTVEDADETDKHQKSAEESVTVRKSKDKSVLGSNLNHKKENISSDSGGKLTVEDTDEADKCQKLAEESVTVRKSKHKTVLGSNLKPKKENISSDNGGKSTVEDTDEADKCQKSAEESVTVRKSKHKLLLESDRRQKKEEAESSVNENESTVEETEKSEHQKSLDVDVVVKKSKYKTVLEFERKQKEGEGAIIVDKSTAEETEGEIHHKSPEESVMLKISKHKTKIVPDMACEKEDNGGSACSFDKSAIGQAEKTAFQKLQEETISLTSKKDEHINEDFPKLDRFKAKKSKGRPFKSNVEILIINTEDGNEEKNRTEEVPPRRSRKKKVSEEALVYKEEETELENFVLSMKGCKQKSGEGVKSTVEEQAKPTGSKEVDIKSPRKPEVNLPDSAGFAFASEKKDDYLRDLESSLSFETGGNLDGVGATSCEGTSRIVASNVEIEVDNNENRISSSSVLETSRPVKSWSSIVSELSDKSVKSEEETKLGEEEELKMWCNLTASSLNPDLLTSDFSLDEFTKESKLDAKKEENEAKSCGDEQTLLCEINFPAIGRSVPKSSVSHAGQAVTPQKSWSSIVSSSPKAGTSMDEGSGEYNSNESKELADLGFNDLEERPSTSDDPVVSSLDSSEKPPSEEEAGSEPTTVSLKKSRRAKKKHR